VTLDPEELFDLDSDRPDLSGAVLLHTLDGFRRRRRGGTARPYDAARRRRAGGGRFDVDQLYDYARGVRSCASTSITGATTTPRSWRCICCHDRDDTPYLMLAGPEPDSQWERYAAAVALLVERLGVRLVIGLDAFPMSVPHSRPTPDIVHARAARAVRDHALARRSWVSGQRRTSGRVPLGTPVLTRSASPLRTAYLSQTEYPAAALALLREVGARAGLRFDTSTLEDAERVNRKAIEREVAGSESCRRWSPLSSSSTTQRPPRPRPRSSTATAVCRRAGRRAGGFLANEARGE